MDIRYRRRENFGRLGSAGCLLIRLQQKYCNGSAFHTVLLFGASV